MDKFMSMLILQMLFAFFTPCLLEIIPIDTVSVHPGENIILHCNISITTNYTQILWYRLGSEEVKLLISAEQGRLIKKFFPTYNVNESQFSVTETCSLVIFDVRQTDLGFHYCEGRKDKTHIQFGKPIRLSFTDGFSTWDSNNKEAELEPSDLTSVTYTSVS
ncbi:uncharacterized protein LOC132857133 isoform X2 [Tachysurus vachellii]|uniref:uncharacterized protein LOC132857133 isoform X2 n=1 Tax=Tachysurus vachellii TaxID=175792 RepID=UPI00296B2B84|nr:uncharacterized protein LOC132857133 isoform X2 [Tachysurus vachellii]